MDQSRLYGHRTGELPGDCSLAAVAIENGALACEVARGLQSHGVVPLLAFSNSDLERCLEVRGLCLVVLDMSLIGDDPRDLIDEIITRTHVAVLTCGNGHAAEVLASSDDHIGSEATSEEIVERAMSLMSMRRGVPLPSSLEWQQLELDTARRTAKWRGRAVHLTTIQFRIMEILVLAAGSVVDADDLARRVWGRKAFDDRARLLAHVRRVRKVIESDPSQPELLLTVRGKGFRLADDSESNVVIDLTEANLERSSVSLSR
jgi:DNA-binding response OmpR family regulator